MTYKAREGSVAWNVIEFFRRRPDEELTTLDVVVKFNAREKSVRIALDPAIEAGLIKAWIGRSPSNKPLIHYAAGPKISKHEEV